jgi:hypothetical protein
MSHTQIIPVKRLTGAALDYAVAQTEMDLDIDLRENGDIYLVGNEFAEQGLFCPSTNFDQGMRIIEREGISLRKNKNLWYAMSQDDTGTGKSVSWSETTYKGGERYGKLSYQINARTQVFISKSLLVSGLRAYLASRVGEKVSIPSIVCKCLDLNKKEAVKSELA